MQRGREGSLKDPRALGPEADDAAGDSSRWTHERGRHRLGEKAILGTKELVLLAYAVQLAESQVRFQESQPRYGSVRSAGLPDFSDHSHRAVEAQ